MLETGYAIATHPYFMPGLIVAGVLMIGLAWLARK